MQNPLPVHHSPHVCNKKIKHTDMCYFHMQLTWLDWSRSRSWSRSFWSRSHERFLVSVSVSHSPISVLALVSLCSGLINKPGAYRIKFVAFKTKPIFVPKTSCEESTGVRRGVLTYGAIRWDATWNIRRKRSAFDISFTTLLRSILTCNWI